MNTHYLRRIKELGARGIISRIYHNNNKKIFSTIMKPLAIQRNAHTSWEKLASTHNISKNFQFFFTNNLSLKFLEKIYTSQLFLKHLPHNITNTKELTISAQKLCNNIFSPLGAKETQFETTKISWQHDIKTQQAQQLGFKSAQNQFENTRNKFYTNIQIPQNTTSSTESYNADIKVPWELSRMQHTFILGHAYKQSGEHRYAKAWYKQVNSWINKNYFLLGVNWVCTMDVAIRACNMAWGVYFFKESKKIPVTFWEKLVCSLYDHARYIEKNWEYSDKPNNHYIADLVGYLYICTFFSNLSGFTKKAKNTKATLQKQFDHQIQQDGTSYEGSTHYHKLITEMYLHFMLISKTTNNNAKKQLIPTFNKMTSFLQDCSVNKHYLVQIGDNDSGIFVAGFAITENKTYKQITSYKNFGISIITPKNWHITFRHPTFTSRQPSGHFHNDQLAITIAIKKQPILIDPGSYLYTANGSWRNIFRSATQHNTFHIPILNDKNTYEDLFQLPRTQQQSITNFAYNETSIWGQDFHTLHKKNKLQAHRKLTFDKTRQELIIEDWFEGYCKKYKTIPINQQYHLPLEGEQICWTLLLHPDVTIKTNDDGRFVLTIKKNIIVYLSSSLPFVIDRGFYSPSYGKRKPCTKLVAIKSMLRAPGHTHHSKREIITISMD